jgi:N-acetylglucosamine kinase-like BadF-type ATPase
VGPVSRLFLAVDGGNSKTDAVLGTEEGRVLAHVRGSGSCYQVIGLPAALDVLSTVAQEAVLRAGLPAGTVLDRAEVYLAGADLPAEVEMLTGVVVEAGWAKETRLDNDLFAILRAGTAAPDAVAVVCGAGTNAVGRRADGATSRFPALGEISGDWGGGHDVGMAALWSAARSADGRGPKTSLEHAVPAHFDLTTPDEVAEAIHLGRISQRRVLELSPLVFSEAKTDEVAAEIHSRLLDEIAAFVRASLVRLDLKEDEVDVALGGGVTRSFDEETLAKLDARLHEIGPRIVLRTTQAPPVLGAALSALAVIGADDGARDRVRRELATAWRNDG